MNFRSPFKYVSDADYRFLINSKLGFYHNMPDAEFLKRRYRIAFGKHLDLDAPVTFNEKLQWLKLYDRKPEYTKMVDKYEVKQYVSDVIGKQYIIPTLGVWDDPEQIDFDGLPKQFVLKCTHDSQGLVICKDKSRLNTQEAIVKLKKALKRNYFWVGREWPYKNVKPRIIAEQYLEEPSKADLVDYKLFCFNGKVKLILICSNRFGKDGLKEDFYDINWNKLKLKRPNHKNSNIIINKPEKIDDMIALAEKLSNGISFLRVDFYIIDNKIYFGELTFFPACGFESFEPQIWDKTLGNWIQLPEKRV